MNEPLTPPSALRWWWPALGMMAIIFIGSTDLGSASHQSRLLIPLLQWLGLGEAAIRGVILTVRKCAHLTEYAFLAVLLWRGLWRRPVLPARTPWRVHAAALPFGICVLYAALDEVHQAFVPSRTGSLVDVMIDAGGAAIGLTLLWLWHRSRRARSMV